MKRIKFLFAWYDIWIGVFYDKKKKWLYILPIPMFGIIIKLSPFTDWMEELKQIAFKWSATQYPLDSKWCEEYWIKVYYKAGLSPQRTWDDYTTMIK